MKPSIFDSKVEGFSVVLPLCYFTNSMSFIFAVIYIKKNSIKISCGEVDVGHFMEQ